MYVGGAEGEIKPSDPPSLFGLWGIVWGADSFDGRLSIYTKSKVDLNDAMPNCK